jgi:formate hydrogenlyase subunit 4
MNGPLVALAALFAVVTAGTVLAPLAVGFIFGVDRKVTASVQLRVGPPLLQPMYDMTKLAAKASAPVDRLAAGLVAAQAVVAAGALGIVLAGGDLVVAVLVLGAARVLYVLAAGAVESPYAQLGVSRELVLLLVTEPLLLLVVIAYGSFGGGFSAGALLDDPPAALAMPTLGITLGVLLAVALRKSPFDLATSHHAHQELVKGSTTELAGPWLALAELGHWYEAAFILVLIALAGAGSPILALGLVLATYLVAVIIDNAVPRGTWQAALALGWGLGGAAVVIALVTSRLLGGGGIL